MENYFDYISLLSLDGLKKEIKDWQESGNKNKSIGFSLLKLTASKLKHETGYKPIFTNNDMRKYEEDLFHRFTDN